MTSILPIHEIESRLKVDNAQLPSQPILPLDSTTLSLKMANWLMDLCIVAECGPKNVFTYSDGENLFTAFRNSADPATLLNIRGETKIEAVPFAGGKAYGPIVDAYRESINLVPLSRGKTHWLAGHGIGGAFALLAAAELSLQGESISAVYTFGAPRVGDHSFVRGLRFPVFRIVNNLDVVPTMPTSWTWRHAGAHKLINADGSLNQTPNPFNRLPGFISQTAWLGELLKQGLNSGFPRSLYTLLNQVLGDHAPAAYRDRLRGLQD